MAPYNAYCSGIQKILTSYNCALCCRKVTGSAFLCNTAWLQNSDIKPIYVILHKIMQKTVIFRKYLSKKLDYLLHTRYNVLQATPHKDHLTALRTACLHLFRHLAQKFLDIHRYACEISIQSDEKFDGAIRTQSLCGIAYNNYWRENQWTAKTLTNILTMQKSIFIP